MLIVQVHIQVKEDRIEEFIAATTENSYQSLLEPGIARFDVLQENDNPSKFILNEVYRTPEAPAAHKETKHYKKWKSVVEDMMAQPRFSVKYSNIHPPDSGTW